MNRTKGETIQTITREELKERMDRREDIQVVEVLAPDEYEQFHLPGAVNVPISDGFEENIGEAIPDRSTPVVVYCLDSDCGASPKAARKMDEMGYEEVYDYEAGKMDWKQAGLPIES